MTETLNEAPSEGTGVSFEEVQHEITELLTRVEMSEVEASYFKEAYSEAVQMMLRMDEVGWLKYNVNNSTGPTIDEARSIAEKLRGWTDSNALLWRGREIRNAFLFGAPYEIGTEDATGSISAQQRNVFENPVNQAAVFSAEALGALEGTRYTDGQSFVAYNRDSKTFAPIPFDQISDIYYNPDNAAEVWYWQRSYDRRTVNPNTSESEVKPIKVWYPADTYNPPPKGYFKAIDKFPVDSRYRMIDTRVNRKPGHTLGVPDSFAAAPWALAYSAYLRDGTKVLAALAEWAWKLTPKKRDSAERSAAAIKSQRGAGGSVITDMDVQALPKGNAVDLNTGRPLASQVAAALGISIVVLLSDPGQSGAYGTAQTLTDPTNRTMRQRRELNTEFLKRCLRVIGIKKPEVTWEKMSPGTDKEEMEIIAMALGTGLFHADEMRPMIAKLAEITMLHDREPDGFMLPNNSESIQRADVDPVEQPGADGTNSQVNGQGKDNLKLGKVSQTPSDSKTTGTTTKPKAASK